MSETPNQPKAPNANDNDREGPTARTYVGLAAGILAAVLLAWFALEFAAWNELQTCALSGRRNCGPPAIPSTR